MGIVQIEGSTKVDMLFNDGVGGGLDMISPILRKRKWWDDLENHVSEQKITLDDPKVDGESKQAKVNNILLNSTSNKGIQSLSRKNVPNSAFPRVFTGKSSVVFSRSGNPTNHSAKSHTWHRTDNHSVSLPPEKVNSNPAHLVKLSPRKFGKIQGLTYIRKGHTLVRKLTLAATLSKDPSTTVVESTKHSISESEDGGTDSESFLIIAGQDGPTEKPKTPILETNTQLLDCANGNMVEMTVLPLQNPSTDSGFETTDSVVSTEDGADSANNKIKSVTNETGKIRYLKRKANQLVAATDNSDLSLEDVDRSQAKSSEGCYKRRRENQIVRTMTESQIDQGVPRFIPSRSFSKKLLGKDSRKMYKFSKFSQVWKLNSTQSTNSSNREKVWPKIFPWKRTTYLTSFMQKSKRVSIDSSVSTISRKLVVARNRNPIYTRSTHGFSLYMSKMLSIDGSSLKWSKSIERKSRKANEVATMAVAAAEKTKRDWNSDTRKSVHSIKPCPGARIYRIGAICYKMDPTKWTLLRMSDEIESPSSSLQSEEKKPYVPRRLVIGKNEYVRVGDGNRLTRDPKKRTKTLASEKVRWSLHTARLRAQKNNYCQFFTRYGTCIKYNDGKCPYIHDRSKIAVCTKFLCHSCSNPNCKLTHEVIPERMQDCSYFLQGICSNVECPYRHVNVNKNASVCEGFLKGYCSDGNECRKKHTYACPVFEETGNCLEGSKCKLHHPKIRSKPTKKTKQKNGRGRYFAKEVRIDAFDRHNRYSKKKEEDLVFQEEKLPDYITLDASEVVEEIGLRIDERSPALIDQTSSSSLDIGRVCHDESIKPIRLLLRASEKSVCF